MKGRVGRYAVWQARDFVFERALPALIVSALILFPIITTMRVLRSGLPAGADIRDVAMATLAQALPLLSFVIVLLAVNGIVSNDRKRGYYRLLFAKPVSLLRYYAQSFAVSAAGALALGAVVLGSFYALAQPIFPGGVFAFLAIYFLGLGGLCFLLSACVRFDWLLLAAIWVMATMLRDMYPAESSWYGRVFDVVLPPSHVVSELAEAFVRGNPVEMSSAVWLAGYGAAAFVAGLVVLSRRPLSS